MDISTALSADLKNLLRVLDLPDLDLVIHADLPTRTFRTYHPRYLRMSRHWGVLDELISRCKVAYGADFNPATLHDRPSHEAAFRELVQHWEPAST